MILDRDLAKLFRRGTELVHVATSRQGEAGRHQHPVVRLQVGSVGQNQRPGAHNAHHDVNGHVLHAHHEDIIMEVVLNGEYSLPEGCRRACTGILVVEGGQSRHPHFPVHALRQIRCVADVPAERSFKPVRLDPGLLQCHARRVPPHLGRGILGVLPNLMIPAPIMATCLMASVLSRLFQ